MTPDSAPAVRRRKVSPRIGGLPRWLMTGRSLIREPQALQEHAHRLLELVRPSVGPKGATTFVGTFDRGCSQCVHDPVAQVVRMAQDHAHGGHGTRVDFFEDAHDLTVWGRHGGDGHVVLWAVRSGIDVKWPRCGVDIEVVPTADGNIPVTRRDTA